MQKIAYLCRIPVFNSTNSLKSLLKMAKSKTFFGLRTGSTKSHTFSILRGQQITKERTSVVSNPKTINQGIQRAIFAAAAKFYSVLWFILNHSWQGIAYHTPSQSEFMRRALNSKLGTSLLKGARPYPFNYEVSAGSLPSITDYGKRDRLTSTLVLENMAGQTPVSDLLAYNPFLVVGDNITVVVWHGDALAGAVTWVIPEDTTTMIGDWNPAEVQGVLPWDSDLSFGEVFQNNGRLLALAEGPSYVNGCFILSRYANETWKRSPEHFFMDQSDTASLAGAYSYMNNANNGSTVDSDYQLDSTDEGVYLRNKLDIQKVLPTGTAFAVPEPKVKVILSQGVEHKIMWYREVQYDNQTYNQVVSPYDSRALEFSYEELHGVYPAASEKDLIVVKEDVKNTDIEWSLIPAEMVSSVWVVGLSDFEPNA